MDRAHHRCRRSRRRDGAVERLWFDPVQSRLQALVYVLLQMRELQFGGWLRLQEHFTHAHRADLFRMRLCQMAILADDELRTPAAHIDYQQSPYRSRPPGLDTHEDQASLFKTGDHF